MERYGRTGDEWEALETAGWEFLVSQARLGRLGRTTSYTEMNTVLARRTGIHEFDFDLDGERHAMGELLGQLSERSFGQARLLISVLVQYLNANDAGPGFYDLATRKHLLRPRPSQDEKPPSGSSMSTPSAHTPGSARCLLVLPSSLSPSRLPRRSLERRYTGEPQARRSRRLAPRCSFVTLIRTPGQVQ